MGLDLILPSLIRDAKAWVKQQRRRHRRSACHVSDKDRRKLSVHFDAFALEAARFKRVSIIENPSFMETIKERGIRLPYDFSKNRGICFQDTVLTSETYRPPQGKRLALLFHQLVHVVQYQVLGLDRYIEEYLEGWIHGGFEYHLIPLERQAYDLQAKFECKSQQLFSVRTQVERALASL